MRESAWAVLAFGVPLLIGLVAICWLFWPYWRWQDERDVALDAYLADRSDTNWRKLSAIYDRRPDLI